jgi:hypothetical protein
MKKSKCIYKNKLCEYWEKDGIGSCLAVAPTFCSYNTAKQCIEIIDWQLKVMKKGGKK